MTRNRLAAAVAVLALAGCTRPPPPPNPAATTGVEAVEREIKRQDQPRPHRR